MHRARKANAANHRCSGFMLMEALLAVAMLAAATGLTVKVVQARIDWDRAAMDRLMRQLSVENVAQFLNAVPIEALEDEAVRWESEAVPKIQVKVELIETQGRSGWHVTIADSESSSIVQHVWRFDRPS